MENNTLYTRCPTCTTAFKVTEKLLSVAAGKVRCGACLAIFQATDYMLKPSERNKIPDAAPPKQSEQTSVSAEANDTSLSKNSAAPDMQAEPPENSYESEPHFEPPSQSDGQPDFEPEPDFENESDFEKKQSTESEPESDLQAIIEHDEVDHPDSLADPEINLDVITDVEQEYLSSNDDRQDSISQAEEITQDAEKISGFDYENQSFEFNDEPDEFDQVVERDHSNTSAQPQMDTEQNNQRAEPSLDETSVIDEISEELSSDSQEILDATTGVSTADVSTADFIDQDLNVIDEDQQFEPIDDIDFDDINTNEPIEEQDAFEVDDLSDQLAEQMQDTDAEPDPLDEFENIVEEKNTDLRRNIIIAAVAILVFVGLQQVWSNRQALAWSESWGGTIKSVCQYLPCDLKARRDVSKIRLLQRQLSPDEENENQLDVKVLLTNEASFDQPYPTIKIAFSNKNGEQVSVKSFPPEEYLEPDSLDKLMPHGTEVHIHFKTEFSHPDALGFEFIFE